MQLQENPDKWIRKAIFDALTLINIPCFEVRQGQGSNNPYVIITTQSKSIEKGNKCKYHWDCNVSLEIIQRIVKTGNTASKVAINDIEKQILFIINSLVVENFVLLNTDYNSNSLTTNGIDENIERIIINLNFKLYEYTN
jgi:hypothetical protein